ALAVDVRLHLRIPAGDAVTEVHAGIDQRFDEFCLGLSHGTNCRFSICNLRLKGRWASTPVQSQIEESRIANLSLSSPARQRRPREPLTPWGLRLIEVVKQKPHRRHSRIGQTPRGKCQ